MYPGVPNHIVTVEMLRAFSAAWSAPYTPETTNLISWRLLEISQHWKSTDTAPKTPVSDEGILFLLQVHCLCGICRIHFHMVILEMVSNLTRFNKRCSHVLTNIITNAFSSPIPRRAIYVGVCHQPTFVERGKVWIHGSSEVRLLEHLLFAWRYFDTDTSLLGLPCMEQPWDPPVCIPVDHTFARFIYEHYLVHLTCFIAKPTLAMSSGPLKHGERWWMLNVFKLQRSRFY